MTRYFLTMMTGKAAGQTNVFSERCLELNSVLFLNRTETPSSFNVVCVRRRTTVLRLFSGRR